VIEVCINDEAPITLERDALGRTTREQLSAHVECRTEATWRAIRWVDRVVTVGT